MICNYCGGQIPQGKSKCPYCGNSIAQTAEIRAEQDKLLEKRYEQIDSVYGFDVKFAGMTTAELEEFLKNISTRLEEEQRRNTINEEKLERVTKHICDVDEELQRRLPIRPEVNYDANAVFDLTPPQVVEHLLNRINPPQECAAAGVLRSQCERQLKDYYKVPYDIKNSKFTKQYSDIFMRIAHNKKDAMKLMRAHKCLNMFVHAGAKNDKDLHSMFPDTQSRVNYLRQVCVLHEKYKLISLTR
jgi:hypothetical protein